MAITPEVRMEAEAGERTLEVVRVGARGAARAGLRARGLAIVGICERAIIKMFIRREEIISELKISCWARTAGLLVHHLVRMVITDYRITATTVQIIVPRKHTVLLRTATTETV